ETTRWKEEGPAHRVWLWDFGDGSREEAVGAAYASMEAVHRYKAPGHYVVQAEAWDTEDKLIRRVVFPVDVQEAGEEHRFPVVSALRPQVDLKLSGPDVWVVERPATYRLQADVVSPPFAEGLETLFDPGEAFRVVWTRPGPGFPVLGGVRVTVTYRFPEGTIYKARHTYVVRHEVEVFTTGLGGQ
ncbi:MAG: PKD domain-containing protein, partial [Bacillota bacterium]|nr:PKD domain-containing protein [Bacillota bacterium]